MTNNYLYTVFHLNLAFSSIPREDYATVIERCYHPILELIEDGFPIAVEASANTLIEIEKLDKEFLRRLRALCADKKTEFIGSGLAQIVMPLAPAKINIWNQEFGVKVYEELLGVRPRVALVGEQTFSAGLVDIYRDAGYEAIIMDWSNSYQYNKYPKDYLYYPQTALGLDTDITVLWSHSISFQKFQRYAHGELTMDEYLEFLDSHINESGNALRSFPLYLNDAEVFSYRPGASVNELKDSIETEWGRISLLLGVLKSRGSFELVLPATIIDETASLPQESAYNKIRLTSPETPIPCKKQKKYNPTRWAVTGRDSVHINTGCWRALKNVLALEARVSEDEFALYKETLCLLWGSDYRTNTTDEKLSEFKNLLGWLMVETERRLDGDSVRGAAKRVTAGSNGKAKIEERERHIIIDAGETSVELLKEKGLAIKSLTMPSLSDKPILGTLPHGYYEDIHFGADFFSGHMINVQRDGTQITDLTKVEARVEELSEYVRVTCKLPLPIGSLEKRFDIFKNEPCLQLTYRLKLSALAASSIRLGIFTINPDLFDMRSLFFEAKNGGLKPERFMLDNHSFDHGGPVSPAVSATTCVGATAGEIIIGDKNLAISIRSDRAELYCVPLIKFSPIDENFFCRVSHSIGETDETSYWTWRGLSTIIFTISPKVYD